MANYKTPVGQLNPLSLGTAALRLGAKAGLGANVAEAQKKQAAEDAAYGAALKDIKSRKTGPVNAKPKQAATQSRARTGQPDIGKINSALGQRSVARVGKPAGKNGGQQLARQQYRAGKRKS